MTDDELTELECAILDACAEAKQKGWRVKPGTTVDTFAMSCCPLGSVMVETSNWDEASMRRQLRLSFGGAQVFAGGFDLEPSIKRDGEVEPLFAMGRRFRERLEAGEL